jgi:hypothetical protein
MWKSTGARASTNRTAKLSRRGNYSLKLEKATYYRLGTIRWCENESL